MCEYGGCNKDLHFYCCCEMVETGKQENYMVPVFNFDVVNWKLEN